MVAKRLTTLALTFGILILGSAAFAQGDADHEKGLLERIDNVGKSIFGAILPGEITSAKEKDAAAKSQTRTAAKNPMSDDMLDEAKSARAGSLFPRGAKPVRPSTTATPSRVSSDYGLEDAVPAIPRTAAQASKPVRRQVAQPPQDAELPDEVGLPNTAARQTPAAESRPVAVSKPAAAREASPVAKPAGRPLHERLAGFRESVFDTEDQEDAAPQTIQQPAQIAERTPASPSKIVVPATKIAPRPLVAQRLTPEIRTDGAKAASLSREPEAKVMPIEAKPAKTESDSVLVARKGPVLNLETVGPRKISVGKEAAYEVHVVNSGEVAAEDLIVYVSLPEWTEVAGAEASVGNAQAANDAANAGAVQWKIGHLNAKGRERLVLRIIPRQSRPFDLAVRWESKPVASQAMIEVQEAKLALQLEGPREVLYGKRQAYRLKVANTGTGSADNVAIMLMPLGGGENVPASHKLGVLPAGEEKTLDVELTARQAGNLTIQVDARADGGVHAEMTEKVLVRRSGLKVDVEGPKVQFVGLPATYAVRVRNPGNTPTKAVRLTVVLPAGAKYISGVENAQADANGVKLEWTLDSLGPDVEQTYAVRCSLGSAGQNRVEVSAAADDDLSSVVATTTRVEAVANLVMDVQDPTGPVAVGEEAVYEIRVRNRGTREAEGVEVFAYFSRGIEPTAADGAPNKLLPGQVTFQPIPSIAPGAELTLKVRARAEVAGNHVFRAEVHCKPLSARLVSEATNLYYADAPVAQQAARELPEGMASEPMPAPARK